MQAADRAGPPGGDLLAAGTGRAGSLGVDDAEGQVGRADHRTRRAGRVRPGRRRGGAGAYRRASSSRPRPPAARPRRGGPAGGGPGGQHTRSRNAVEVRITHRPSYVDAVETTTTRVGWPGGSADLPVAANTGIQSDESTQSVIVAVAGLPGVTSVTVGESTGLPRICMPCCVEQQYRRRQVRRGLVHRLPGQVLRHAALGSACAATRSLQYPR